MSCSSSSRLTSASRRGCDLRRSPSSRATARGFSGFGSALIFMPLASSMAAPRLVAALLLIIDFVGALPLLPNAWRQADRKATAVMVLGALVGVPVGTWLLTPARSRDDALDHLRLRGRAVAAAAVRLALSRQGSCRRCRSASAACQASAAGLAQTGGPPIVGYWLGRPIALANRARQHRAVLRRVGFLFGGELCRDRTDHTAMRSRFRCSSARSMPLGVWLRHLAVRPRQRDRCSARICYVLIAAAVIFGLPVARRRAARALGCRPTRTRREDFDDRSPSCVEARIYGCRRARRAGRFRTSRQASHRNRIPRHQGRPTRRARSLQSRQSRDGERHAVRDRLRHGRQPSARRCGCAA